MTALWAIAAGIVALLGAGAGFEQAGRRRDARRRRPGRHVIVGDRRLYVHEIGQGSPAVVFLHGAGDGSDSWAPVARAVGEFTRAIAFDRPGLGGSDPGPPPDAERSVREVEGVLDALNATGPVVLVGHSLGGVVARRFALSRPDRVVGLVLVDSSHEGLVHDAAFRRGFAVVSALLRVLGASSAVGLPRVAGDLAGIFPMYQAEVARFRRAATPEEFARWKAMTYRNCRVAGGRGEIDAAIPLLSAAAPDVPGPGEPPSLGDLPLIVLTNPGFGADWIAMHRELAARSSRGIHRIVELSGHNVQMNHPAEVVAAIREIVEATGGGAART